MNELAVTTSATTTPEPNKEFWQRHIGTRPEEQSAMLDVIGAGSLPQLTKETVPDAIRTGRRLDLGWATEPHSEAEAIAHLRSVASGNDVFRSMIGMGYYDTIVPPVIARNILENPGWYTQYTPYQAEISQGRLELLLNFQTMVSDLTALPIAGASLLDEATAAAEAMAMAVSIASGKPKRFLVDVNTHPQTIAVIKTRGESLGIEVEVGTPSTSVDAAAILLSNPGTDGTVTDYTQLITELKAKGTVTIVATDLLSLALTKAPGEMGADIAVGSAQRFGVPMGYGGPHAAYLATKEEHTRKLPGRIIGVSKDSAGRLAYRMAIQTREQHIRRDKATSNICTAQALLAMMNALYAVYHGPKGIQKIASRVHKLTVTTRSLLEANGFEVLTGTSYFDTLKFRARPNGPTTHTSAIRDRLESESINIRYYGGDELGVSLDETTTLGDIETLINGLTGKSVKVSLSENAAITKGLTRTSTFLTHEVFNRHHSETEMLRYIRKLESRDLSLGYGMIPLGSCTMKLNATSEMLAVSWPEFAGLHPFAPRSQAAGYTELFSDLEQWLANITGFAGVSLQPNAGSQGEYAGLLVIRAYHHSRGDTHRNICLIPDSAHGTNPASAVIAGMKVVAVKCDANGNVDITDLRAKAQANAANLAALMVTYPSTHGVFETAIKEICQIVHEAGGQVYMDGANMNAQVGLTSPGEIGADVCHLNLHKTFCIPHGGGGPGMGPIGVAKHLVPFLPTHPVTPSSDSKEAIGAVSAAPWGSPSILVIPWMYIVMMGADGLKYATESAILHANYMAKKLEGHYPVLFVGEKGRVAHEFILDCRPFEASAGIKVEDIAKRLMDYGFHAPTMSFPVPGTLMIEPTESEPLSEINRFIEAMISIRKEIADIESGNADRLDNTLKNAPHTHQDVIANEWTHKYTREMAAYPTKHEREWKFWPHVSRIDNAYGDRNLMCTCPTVEELAS